ncbi:hypothetical protein GCM10008983_01560 [Lentibacillus halophilus]|uniref:Uncharacterized protein n=1 Tax=Lentibacillus halophilus TaxID=295065 RepID=A0ABP3IX63_9BACI
MVAQFEIRDKVLEFVQMATLSPVKGFYPTSAAKYVNTSVQTVFPYLIDLVKTEELILVWELRCPNFDCNKTINDSKFESISIDDEMECPKCGYEFEVSNKDFFPRFDISSSYKEYLNKKDDNSGKKKRVFSLQT